MKKVLIFGTGKIYDCYYNLLRYLELLGQIQLCNITSSKNPFAYDFVDTIPYIDISSVNNNNYDFVLIAADIQSKSYKEIYQQSISLGFKSNQLFPIEILQIPNFDFDAYLKVSDMSIISNNCWGGFTYHNLKLPFRSPFINLGSPDNDYIKLVKNFSYYMHKEVEFYQYLPTTLNGIETSTPWGKIDDVLINFLHYKTFEEALTKWNERKQRINYDNLFFMMYTDSPDIARQFCEIDVKKVCFTSFKCDEYEDIYYCPSQESGLPLWDYVNKTARGVIKDYNVLDLLTGGPNIKRI